MNDFVTSLIRSYVPIVVGGVAAFFAARNVELDQHALAGLTAALTTAFYATYYALVRLFEHYVSPKFGWLLGTPKAPNYKDEPKE